MLDDDQGDSPHCDAVKQAFNDAWAAGDLTLACAVYVEHVKTRLIVFFAARGLSEDDAADCADEALARMLKLFSNEPTAILNAYGYIFTAAVKISIDLGEENKRHYICSPEDIERIPSSLISPEWAQAIAFEAVEEAEPLPHWAVPAVTLALSRLPVCQRKVLLAFASSELGAGNPSFEPNATEVAEHLGMTSVAVRKNKERGHQRLREEVRRAVNELDLVLPPRLEEAIFSNEQRPGDEED